MKLYRIFLILSMLPHLVIAQEIAIIDQGKNTLKTNNGAFYNPICFGVPNLIWSNPFNVSIPPNLNGTDVVITQANLCGHAYSGDANSNTASVPRYWSFNDLNANNQPFTSVTMAVTPRPVSPRTIYFNPPFKNIQIGNNLVHGTHVANAADEFDSSVRKKMMQVYHIDGIRTNSSCLSSATYTISPNTAVTGGAEKILAALREITNRPDGVDAINMSIVFRQPCNLRQDGDLVPALCKQSIGQDEVNDLHMLGIPLVVGLHNIDIEPNEKTWPACLSGVIKVGAQNDNNNLVNGGIGIGANDIDFYAKNTVSANGGAAGNSMAAPRIAAAYALLKTAVPNSTVEQRTEALRLANSRTNTYKGGYTRRHVKKTDIDEAIELLEEMVYGNIDNIFFDDPNQYGSIYADNSSNYTFEINFDELIGSNPLAKSNGNALTLNNASMVDGRRDVVLSFDGKMASNSHNGFRVYINNIQREYINSFLNERSFEFVFNRNIFNSGNNTVRIEPTSSQRLWGLSNIKADFHPVIPLTVDQTNISTFGYFQTPPRYTGLRASFEVDNLESDYLLSVNAWDIDTNDENQVFLNGEPIGYLTPAASSSYNGGDTFVLRKENLIAGQNVIEFVQRYLGNGWGGIEDEKWAVKDMLVVVAPADLSVPEIAIVDRSLKNNVPFAVSASVHNSGAGYADVTTLNFYVSTDETISTADTLIHSASFESLGPNRTRIINTSVTSSQVNQGYFLGACITMVQGESNNSNNCSAGVLLKNNVNIVPIIMLLLDN